MEPGNQAATLLSVEGASGPTILSLEPSQAYRVCILLPGSPVLELSLESLVESQVKVLSIGFSSSSVFSILDLISPHKWGGYQVHQAEPPCLVRRGGHLVFQSALFSIYSPTAIHPIGAAFTPYDWGLFSKVYYSMSAVFCMNRVTLHRMLRFTMHRCS
jgi:hypothetical protein